MRVRPRWLVDSPLYRGDGAEGRVVTALAMALALGALCGGAIALAVMLERRDQARVTFREQRQRQIAEVREVTVTLTASGAAATLAVADAVESLGRYAVEHERALRKRRT